MNKGKQLALTLTVALTAISLGQTASAQGLEAGQTESFSPSAALGQDQETLLPPEVAPMSQGNGVILPQSQAQNTATPGLASQSGNFQSAQDYRKAAFESLYGSAAPAMPQQMSMDSQWKAGQFENAPGLAQNQPMGQSMSQPMGQPMGQPMMPMANNTQSQGFPTQSQTLTGSVRNQPVVHDTRRGGFSNTLSHGLTFAAGMLTTAAYMRPQSGLPAAGMYGLTMTGFGVRNGFRF